MSRVNIAIICVVTCLFCGGCFSDYREPIPLKEGMSHVPEKSDGYLIGTFVYSGVYPWISDANNGFPNHHEKYNYNFRFRSKDNKSIGGNIVSRRVTITMLFPLQSPDYNIEAGSGYLFVVSIPQGSYEFYECSATRHGGTVTEYAWTPKDFSIPFSINAGEALYLGEIKSTIVFNKGFLGRAPGDHIHWSGSNQWDRDIPLITSDYPFVSKLEISERPIGNDLARYFGKTPPTNASERAKSVKIAKTFIKEPGVAKLKITTKPGFAANDFIFEVKVNDQLATKLVEASTAEVPLKKGMSSVIITNTKSPSLGRPYFKPIHFDLNVNTDDEIDVTISYKNNVVNWGGTVTIKQNNKVTLQEDLKTIFRLL